MHRTRTRHLVMLFTWLVSAAIVITHRRDAFYDVDEGLLGETAERVMHGQLPHRDFVDVYTGALGMIDAAGFRIGGVSAETLRTVLVVATLVWIPGLFLVAARLARPRAGAGAPWAAALATLTAVCWSVPNHPRGMPTWYTLFLATAGTAAMLRYLDTRRRRWLVVAGVAAGVSCTIKIVGLYFIAAVLLLAVFDEQESDHAVSGRPAVTWYTVFIDGALVLYALAVAWLVRGQGLAGFVHYAVPSAAVAALLIWREHAMSRATPVLRAARLLAIIVPFAVGVAIPIAVFFVPYVQSGAVGALVHGVFVVPARRIAQLQFLPPPAVSVLAAVPLVAALGLFGRRRLLRGVLVSTVALGVVVVSGVLQPLADPALRTPVHVASRLARDAEHGLIPLLVIVGAVALARRKVADPRAVALIVAVMATGTLVQFPYALDQYFLFVAPLVVLTALALAPTRAAAIVAVGCLCFAAIKSQLERYPAMPLAIPRGGPLVSADINAKYQALVATVGQHARGQYIYAGPDSPQVYFLTGYRNPTRTLYEMFDDAAGPGQSAAVLAAIDAHGVTTVVLNTGSGNVSGPMDPALRAALIARFPAADTIGQYVVRWR